MHEMEARFQSFAMSMEGAESIDDLPIDTSLGQRADYLWRGRSVVVEVKLLRGDPQDKINKMFDELQKRDDFPVFLGKVNVHKLVEDLPDGPDLLRRLHQKVMRSTEAAFRDAKDQIASTKRLLGLQDALGVMVLLNPDIEALDPVNVGQEISRLMEKRQHDTWSVDVVWLLSEAHFMENASPCILIEGSKSSRLPWADAYLATFNDRWAGFNNSPMINSDSNVLADMDFQRKSERVTNPLTNEQRWRATYRANPYLAKLDDEAVRAFGYKVAMEMKPYFLEGGPRVPMADLELRLERWTHFLEEASRRGLDVRGWDQH